ncbi:hypothetical protein Bca52824_032435 [Brassica carinata]|uniref:Polygalacturonase n=1 Tax=Brassica carinata TaxID=52824 RepID=A0A8X7SB35_BRACI|nr:hypothetical protein Bca52824_032435 [Brassica carinata]
MQYSWSVFKLLMHDFGGVGDGVTVDTEAFERAVVEISKLGGSGGGQLNVPPGQWLTAPFNLTSHMTLFLAEDSEILGVEVTNQVDNKCYVWTSLWKLNPWSKPVITGRKLDLQYRRKVAEALDSCCSVS